MVQPVLLFNLGPSLLLPKKPIKGGLCLRPFIAGVCSTEGYQCQDCDKHRLSLPISDGGFPVWSF